MSTSSSVTFLTRARTIPPPEESIKQLALDLAIIPGNISQQDMYGDFSSTPDVSILRRFEAEVSTIFGKEDAIFLPSGTMAQQIALCIHSEGRNKLFVCHYSSHLLLHEQNSYNVLLGFSALIIPKKDNQISQPPLSAGEVISAILSSSILPSTVIVECPMREIGGKCIPWEDLVELSTFCRDKGIAFHLDGARVWEATSGYHRSLSEICSLFDSVYASFYKGLGGMTGAMLIGQAAFIKQARVWLRRFGGNVFTLMPYAVSCWAAMIRNKESFNERTKRLQHITSILNPIFSTFSTLAAESHPPSVSLPLIRFDPQVPSVSMIHVYMRCNPTVAMACRDRVLDETGISCFTMVRGGQQVNVRINEEEERLVEESCFEFNMVTTLFSYTLVHCTEYIYYIDIHCIRL
jgi:threonine aldolase